MGDNGYETPDENGLREPFSLTPENSSTKFEEKDTDILTQFIIDASGFVDEIERSQFDWQYSSNRSDNLQHQNLEARTKLQKLKENALRNEQFRSFVKNKFSQVNTPERLDKWLCTLINTHALQTRQLLIEAQQAGAEVAKRIRQQRHESRKKQAQLVLGGEVGGDDAETTTCVGGPCVVQLRL